MLRVELSNARPGMTLALPVQHPRYYQQVLLKRGYTLESQTIGRMLELGVRSVWVDYPSLDFLDRMLPTELLQTQGKLVHEIASGFEQAQSRSVARLPFDTYRQSISDLVNQLIGNPAAAVFLGDLSQAAGEGLMRHSSTEIGRAHV